MLEDPQCRPCRAEVIIQPPGLTRLAEGSVFPHCLTHGWRSRGDYSKRRLEFCRARHVERGAITPTKLEAEAASSRRQHVVVWRRRLASLPMARMAILTRNSVPKPEPAARRYMNALRVAGGPRNDRGRGQRELTALNPWPKPSSGRTIVHGVMICGSLYRCTPGASSQYASL